MLSMAFSMAMVGASSVLSKFSPIKVGYDGINNAGIYNTSKSYIATAKSAKKSPCIKLNNHLLKKQFYRELVDMLYLLLIKILLRGA